MQLIAPDVLTEARGLSPSVPAVALAVGWLLWLFGWRWNRFWTVVGVTVAGGLYGLSSGQAGNGHMLALGLLLAVSAGLLAMEIARLFAFAAGGTVVWWTASTLLPKGQELWVFFLVGGLAGVLFYRLWMMTLTSFIGSVIAGHALLTLLERFTRMDMVTWASRNALALTVAIGLTTALGLGAQGAQYRWRRKGEDQAVKKKKKDSEHAEHESPDVKALREAFNKPH